jgi:hypothetical protein
MVKIAPLMWPPLSSLQMELDGKKHPRGDRLCPSPGRLEAPLSHRIDRCVVEIRVSGGDLDEDLAYATVGQDLDTQTRRTLNARSTRCGRIVWIHLITALRTGPPGDAVCGGPRRRSRTCRQARAP